MKLIKNIFIAASLCSSFTVDASVISYDSYFGFSATYAHDYHQYTQPFNGDTTFGPTASTTVGIMGFDTTLGTLNNAWIELDSSYSFTALAWGKDQYDNTGVDDTTAIEGFAGIEMWLDPAIYSDPATSYNESSLFVNCSETNSYPVDCLNSKSTGWKNFDHYGLDLGHVDVVSGDFGITLNMRSYADITGIDDDTSGYVESRYASWNGTFTVHYYYTPYPETVPEPSILALMGLGLAGLGFARRRKVQA